MIKEADSGGGGGGGGGGGAMGAVAPPFRISNENNYD